MNEEAKKLEQEICSHLKEAWCIKNGSVKPVGSSIVSVVSNPGGRLVKQISNGRCFHLVDKDRDKNFYVTISYE